MNDELIVVRSSKDQPELDGEELACLRGRRRALGVDKPMRATPAIRADLDDAALRDIWTAYIAWREQTAPTLPEDERLFVALHQDLSVWVWEAQTSFTILYPEDD